MKMRKNYGVIAAGGLGTRLKTFKDNIHTKVLIELPKMRKQILFLLNMIK